MRIGIDARFLDSNKKTGVASYMTNLINNLALIDKQNEYVLYFNSIKRDVIDFPGPEKPNFKKRVIKLPSFNSKYFNEVWAFFLTRVMKKEGIQIAHFMCSSFPNTAYFKTVSTVHDLTSYRFPDLQNFKKTEFIFLKKMLERTVSKADSIIAVSEQTKNDLLSFFSFLKQKIEVIPLGTNYRAGIYSENLLDDFKKKYNLGEKNILFVGAFEKRKNIEILLNAFSELVKFDNFRHKLILVGKPGSASMSLMAMIEKLGIRDLVILPGYVPNEDIPYFYHASEMLVFPSFYEGFGLPCLESMEMGIPMILSDIPVFREVADTAGVFFNPSNKEDLKRIISKLASDSILRGNLVKIGLERVKKFSWENTAIKTLTLYKKIGCS